MCCGAASTTTPVKSKAHANHEAKEVRRGWLAADPAASG
jgi:hypothetical protein